MADIILSLLLLKSMTIYEIRAYIHHNLGMACSDSMGSIQAALKKLEREERITSRELTEGGRNKKEYCITDKGLEQFTRWIQTPMDLEKARNMEESKFFFLGMAPKETRIQMLERYITSLYAEREKLLEIQKQVDSTKEHMLERNLERISKDQDLCQHLSMVSGETDLACIIQNINRYQIYMLESGLQKTESEIKFYENILERERGNEK